uniref:Replication-associated protein n=1 Tax=Digitaria ciliaris striate mosaic virus TaxID=1196237 RepID=J7FGV7_9GEMI|nr:RepA [Digitaria ciliaris striate mosaic virus]
MAPPVSDTESANSANCRLAERAPGAAEASFEVRAKNIFLTYSKCLLDPQEALRDITHKLRKFEPTYVYVARELHQDGTFHLHCFVQCKKHVRTTRARFFDLEEYHPNVQNARMPHKVLAYCKKSPVSYAEEGAYTESDVRKRKIDASTTKDAKMADIIRSSKSKEEYLSMVRKTFPFDWATRLQNFEYSAERLFPSTPPPYVSPFNMPSQEEHPVLGAWLRAELYTVSPYAYSIHSGLSEEQARADLQWMHDTSRAETLLNEENPSTSADQFVPERPPGPEVWASITTGNTASTSSTSFPTLNTM